MQLTAPTTLLALFAPLLSIPVLALPTLQPVGTSGTDLNTPALNVLTSDSLVHHYTQDLHIPTTRSGRSDHRERDCAPIGFKNGHKICDPKCDPENCNNLPARETREDDFEVEDSGEDEMSVKGGKEKQEGRARNNGVRFGHWFMNSPPIEKGKRSQGGMTGLAA